MNFQLHFNLYKKELCDKIESDNLNEIEMSILNQKSEGLEKVSLSITTSERDKDVVKLLVDKH